MTTLWALFAEHEKPPLTRWKGASVWPTQERAEQGLRNIPEAGRRGLRVDHVEIDLPFDQAAHPRPWGGFELQVSVASGAARAAPPPAVTPLPATPAPIDLTLLNLVTPPAIDPAMEGFE